MELIRTGSPPTGVTDTKTQKRKGFELCTVPATVKTLAASLYLVPEAHAACMLQHFTKYMLHPYKCNIWRTQSGTLQP